MPLSTSATREELMQFLSTVPTTEILNFLEDNVIAQLATRQYTTMAGHTRIEDDASDSIRPVESEVPITSSRSSSQSTSDRAKRPLNAFMAFRSYYLKLFPDVQQKSASGFLTTLWNRDPCRNKWALIAKVYSFIRDEVGKNKVPLGPFLTLSCPIMQMTEPASYLATLGWSVRDSHDGQKLIQDEGVSVRMESQQAAGCPTTEVELVSALVRAGYLPTEGLGLLDRMMTNTRGLMTTTTKPINAPVPYVSEKVNFIATIRRDPIQATKDILGEAYDDEIVRKHGIMVHSVPDLNSISHLSMQPLYPPPATFYNYSNSISPPTEDTLDMPLGGISDFECIDIDNPFDLDAVLGYTQPEGERTAGLPPSPPFDHEQDFQFLF